MLALFRTGFKCTLWQCRGLQHSSADPFGTFPRSRNYSHFSSQDQSNAWQQFKSLAHCAPYPVRTHSCGSLTAGDAGSQVILAGWILSERKGKLLSFFPLKDSFGTTQLIVNHSEKTPELSGLSKIPLESTVLIEGTVHLRPPSARRPGPTGDIDVYVHNFTLLNPAVDLPFVPSDPHNLANDDLRARYRYLDLRRSSLSDNLKKRSEVAHIVRNVLHEQDFFEVETPILLRSSPEGAREFLVPTRTSKTSADGSMTEEPLFYALQQSPQQPKQLLICSGIDKYFQLAKCFRDEDGRKDRQPEFTQVDLEMAFVSWGASETSTRTHTNTWRIGGSEVRDVVETLIQRIWHRVEGVILPKNFEVMTYYEAMTRFGSDKPDTRFGLEIADITHFLPPSQRAEFANNQDVLECFVVRRTSNPDFIWASRACECDSSVERILLTDKNLESWLVNRGTANRSSPEISQYDGSHVNEKFKPMPGDHVWLARRPQVPKGGSTALGRQRLRLSELAQAREAFIVSKDPHFLWITEFPLFTQADEDKDFLAKGRWSSSHHPFTAPMWQDIEDMYSGQIESVRGQHYDLVLNGVEIGGGSVRIHDAAMQEYIFKNILKLNEEERTPFNHLLHALRCGAPPHGGIALGFDRLMAMLCNTQSIRDVIAFPKTSLGTDLLFRSPASVNNDRLYQYGIESRRRHGS